MGFVSKRPALDDMPPTLLHFHLLAADPASASSRPGKVCFFPAICRVGWDRALRLAGLSLPICKTNRLYYAE